MSKELEALEKLGEKERITGVKNACYLVDKIKNDSEFETVKQALTPPTVDEVCKALSEYLKEEIIYESTSFLYKGSYAEVCALGNLNGVYFSTHLPPHLIALIGRFYEGEIK